MDDYARSNGEAALLTEQVRALEPGTPEYAEAKSLLCAHAPAGVFNPFRAQRCMTVNGLGYVELDDAYDIVAAREALEADPSIARAALSPGGAGLSRGGPGGAPSLPTCSSSSGRWSGSTATWRADIASFSESSTSLVAGIDLHYLPSAPDALFRGEALPLMTGAPPSRYTEERRRTVPGFGAGKSARLGPFEDTTDPACLAWRDRTRRRIWTALAHLDLPDGSRNDVLDSNVFLALVGAELEGRALYEVSIGARDLFGAWTRAAAYPGSTKPQRAEQTFDELSTDFDLDRGEVGSIEALYSRARAAGWDGKTSDDGDHESANASEQEHETSDTESGGGTDGADSASSQGECRDGAAEAGPRAAQGQQEPGWVRPSGEGGAPGRGDEGRLRLHHRAEGLEL